MAIPKRLRREPLVEAIWQVIFEDPAKPSPGELMLGILYSHLREKGTEWEVRRLPTAEIPPFVLERDHNLRYAVKFRLESPRTSILYQVGDRVVSVNCRRPYVGWNEFRRCILEVADLIQKMLPWAGPLQHSLRYLDIFPRDLVKGLDRLGLQLSLGGEPIVSQPLHLRVVISYHGCEHILQVFYPADIQLPDGSKVSGTLTDLETYIEPPNRGIELSRELDTLHDATMAMFFERVLTPELIRELEPEY